MLSLEFLLTSLVVVITPGTGVLYTVSTGLSQGKLASLYAAVGCTLGIVPHMLAAGLGLAATLHAGALALQILKVLGVLYLLYLAVLTWRDRSAFSVDDRAKVEGPFKLIIKAVLLNSLNPKLTLFFMAFLPQFIEAGSAQHLFRFSILSAVFIAMTFVIFIGYGLLAHAFRQTVVESPAVQSALRRGFAVAFLVMAIKLAWPHS